VKIQLWAIGAILLSAISGRSAISKNQALEIASSFIRSVDDGFLEDQLHQEATLIQEVQEFNFGSRPSYYSVWFRIPDYKQELVFDFQVLIFIHNGEVISPPAGDEPHYGMGTYLKWLSQEDYCRFHSEDSACNPEIPI
jgi:hypothetical protein